MRTRLVPYVPFGAKLAPLPDALEAQLVTPLGELPTASVHYHRDGTNATVLDGIVEVGFEYWNGTTWVEPPSARFLSMSGSFDHLEETPTRTYSFIGIGWMLRRAKVWEPNGLPVDADGKVQFLSANAGTIMATLIQNAKGRGWGAGITVDFSATKDSSGQAWAKILTIAYDLDLDLEAVLSNLYQQGVCDYRWEGRTLRIFNSDTTMGRDLTTGTNPLRLIVADGQSSAPEDWTNEDLITDALVLGEEGKSWTFANGSNTPLGRLETVITQGGVNDPGTASLLSEVDLLQGSQTRVSYTREFAVYDDSPVWPFRDFVPGDWVQAQRGLGFERLRTHSLSLTISASGVRGHSVLGDRLDDLLTKLAKRTKGITGGASAGGSGVKPAPEGPDNRVPSAPVGLTVYPLAYLDETGTAQGMVDLDWAHSGTAVGGTAMSIDRFQVYYRVNSFGMPWKQLLSTQESDAQYSPLAIFKEDRVTLEEYGFKVRAVADNGKASAFTPVVAVLMEDDTVPPPVPSAPVGEANYGVITVLWDGFGAGGETMPADFSHVDGEVGPSPLGPWRVFGSIPGAGSMAVPFMLDYGTYWLRLRSVDRSGNKSEWSALGEVESRPLVELPDIHNLIGEIDTSIRGVLNSANGKNRVIHSPEDPSADGMERDGDTWFKWTNGTHISDPKNVIGQWTWVGGSYRPTALGHQVIASIDLGKGTFGFLDGIHLKAGTVNAGALIVGDFTNLATLDPDREINVTMPDRWRTETVGDRAQKASGGESFLMFMNQTGPVPVESGDWVRVSFNAEVDAPVSAVPTVWVYPNKDTSDGYVAGNAPAMTFDAGAHEYVTDIQVPDLDSISGGKSWVVGIDGAASRDLRVRNVRVYKKTNATLIGPGSIRTPHIDADAIRSYHIQTNSIEADRMVGGFADFMVVTGSTLQTLAEANMGIKILAGGLNQIVGFNPDAVRTFYLDGNTGDLILGKNGDVRIWGDTGNISIGNGKLLVSGDTGDVTMVDATLTAGVVQSTLMDNRGVRMDANGIRAWDGSGNQRFSLNANTGRVVAEGEFATSSSGRRARLSDTNLTAGLSLYADNTEARGAIYAVKPETSNMVQTAYRFHPGSNTDFSFQYAMTEHTWRIGNMASQHLIGFGSGNDTGTGFYLESPAIHGRSFTAAGNVVITSNGILGTSSSASRFKIDPQPMALPDALLDIPIMDWIDRTEFEQGQELATLGVRSQEQQGRFDTYQEPARVPGVIAETVAGVSGGEPFVTRRDGEIQGVSYERLAMAQIQVLNRQLKTERERNDRLEDRLAALEKKLR